MGGKCNILQKAETILLGLREGSVRSNYNHIHFTFQLPLPFCHRMYACRPSKWIKTKTIPVSTCGLVTMSTDCDYMLHEFQEGRNATEACRNLSSEAALSVRTCRRWYEKFQIFLKSHPLGDYLSLTRISSKTKILFLTTSQIAERPNSAEQTISDHIWELEFCFTLKTGRSFRDLLFRVQHRFRIESMKYFIFK